MIALIVNLNPWSMISHDVLNQTKTIKQIDNCICAVRVLPYHFHRIGIKSVSIRKTNTWASCLTGLVRWTPSRKPSTFWSTGWGWTWTWPCGPSSSPSSLLASLLSLLQGKPESQDVNWQTAEGVIFWFSGSFFSTILGKETVCSSQSKILEATLQPWFYLQQLKLQSNLPPLW